MSALICSISTFILAYCVMLEFNLSRHNRIPGGCIPEMGPIQVYASAPENKSIGLSQWGRQKTMLRCCIGGDEGRYKKSSEYLPILEQKSSISWRNCYLSPLDPRPSIKVTPDGHYIHEARHGNATQVVGKFDDNVLMAMMKWAYSSLTRLS